MEGEEEESGMPLIAKHVLTPTLSKVVYKGGTKSSTNGSNFYTNPTNPTGETGDSYPPSSNRVDNQWEDDMEDEMEDNQANSYGGDFNQLEKSITGLVNDTGSPKIDGNQNQNSNNQNQNANINPTDTLYASIKQENHESLINILSKAQGKAPNAIPSLSLPGSRRISLTPSVNSYSNTNTPNPVSQSSYVPGGNSFYPSPAAKRKSSTGVKSCRNSLGPITGKQRLKVNLDLNSFSKSRQVLLIRAHEMIKRAMSGEMRNHRDDDELDDPPSRLTEAPSAMSRIPTPGNIYAESEVSETSGMTVRSTINGEPRYMLKQSVQDAEKYESKRMEAEKEGKPVPKNVYASLETMWAVVIVRKYFRDMNFSIADIATFLELPTRTCKDIWKRYKKRGTVEREKKGPTTGGIRKLDPQIANAISSFVDEANIKRAMPVLKDIMKHLQDQGLPVRQNKTIRRYLYRMGYTFKKIKPQYLDKKKPNVTKNKIIYLRQIMANRMLPPEERMEEIYIDESFVNEYHCRPQCWIKKHSARKIMKPANYNNRICLVGGIHRQGWIGCDYSQIVEKLRNSEENGEFFYGSIMFFKAQNAPDQDPHSNFNKILFQDYFQNKLIPSIKKPSLIIMDRCPYHTNLDEDVFNPKKAKKSEVTEFLLGEGIPFKKSDSTTHLRELAAQEISEQNGGEEPETVLLRMARISGHRGVYLPQYHPEFNPIEMCWAMLKSYIGDKSNYSLTQIERQLLPSAFASVSKAKIQSLYRHTEKDVQVAWEAEVLPNVDLDEGECYVLPPWGSVGGGGNMLKEEDDDMMDGRGGSLGPPKENGSGIVLLRTAEEVYNRVYGGGEGGQGEGSGAQGGRYKKEE